jgi:hypothetical protein
MPKKEYLGDSVYVDFDGYHVVLTTENGISKTNEIFLENSVMIQFTDWYERLKKELANGD